MTQRPRRLEHDTRVGGFVLPKRLKKEAYKRAEKEGISISELLRRALRKYLGWKL